MAQGERQSALGCVEIARHAVYFRRNNFKASKSGVFVPWPFFTRIIPGYLLACATVSLTIAAAVIAVALLSWNQTNVRDFSFALLSPMLTFPAVVLLSAIPFLIFMPFTEIRSVRKRKYYLIAGGASGALAIPVVRMLMYGPGPHLGEFVASFVYYALLLGPLGILGGYIYWRISGKRAGTGWRCDPRPADDP